MCLGSIWNPLKIEKNTILIKYDPKWKLYTFMMGFTMHEKKTPVPPDAGCEI